MRDLRQKTKSSLETSQAESGKIQPHYQEKAKSEFAVDALTQWQAGFRLYKMYKDTF